MYDIEVMSPLVANAPPIAELSLSPLPALHDNFKPTWKRFKRSMANENYAKQFLKAVIVYNSDHIK